MFLLIFYAGAVSRAYFGAAASVASTVAFASVLSAALYPKLLGGGGVKDVAASLEMTFMLAIPMAVGSLILAVLCRRKHSFMLVPEVSACRHFLFDDCGNKRRRNYLAVSMRK
jgi:hypothetical protein